MKRTVEAFENFLVSKKFLSQDQLEKVRNNRLETKETLKNGCIKLGFTTEESYGVAEARFLEIPFANLDDYILDPEILKLIPSQIAKKQGVFPMFKIEGILTLAVHDPHNLLVIDQIRDLVNLDIEIVLVAETDITHAISETYGAQGIADVAKVAHASIQQEISPSEGVLKESMKRDFLKEISVKETDAPVVQLVNETITRALQDKASDIHIEPEADFVRIRNRIDGVLIEVARLPKDLQNPVISRVKIMAKLDIAESRKPQDGKIRLDTEGRDIDIRVSSFPTTYGENLVLRLLDRASVVLDLSLLGFSNDLLEKFKKLVNKPYGIILVTGPTGAGKTTTLYAALQTINEVTRNIMTIEDPIEYQIPMIRQTQVNAKAGLTFANGLRNLLRQDPDVMLVGEIRDKETAEIAVESALTGHLVFSTLHTNDAPGAITRLMDIEIEPFLISSSLIGVLAQRLVRVICTNCKKAVSASHMNLDQQDLETLQHLKKRLKRRSSDKSNDGLMLYEGEGCKNCKKTGFKGRVAIFELMIIDEKIRSRITRRNQTADIRELSFNDENLSMKLDGLMKVLEGVTTVEEVLKVVQDT